MEGSVEIIVADAYFIHNKGKRCVIVRMHDGSIIKLIIASPPIDQNADQ